jgi:hypothetical protein
MDAASLDDVRRAHAVRGVLEDLALRRLDVVPLERFPQRVEQGAL